VKIIQNGGKPGLGWVMTNIREVLAKNLKKFRQERKWSQAKLAEKTGTSTHYIGMLETKFKFPSSEMIHKLAAALRVDPTELFFKEADPVTVRINYQTAAFEDAEEAISGFLSAYIKEKIEKLEKGAKGRTG
jgi:transcriptional regulator with XRE-family HTH domain